MKKNQFDWKAHTREYYEDYEGQMADKKHQEDPEKKEPKHWIEHVMFIIALGTIAAIAFYKC